jgi:PAS domain S-box-containing protein
MEESTGSEAGADEGASTESGVADPAGEFDRSRLATVADRLPSPVVVFDDEGVIQYVNDALATQFGYDRSTLVGADLPTLCPMLSASAVEAHCTDESDEPLTTHGELADGTARAFDLSVERWPDTEGVRYVATLRDVTDRQERLRELEQYERIVETIDDGVYILDDAFNIISVNDAATDLTGYEEAELVGSNASLLATEETIQQAAAVSEALFSGESEAASLTTTLGTADGDEVPVETAFPSTPSATGATGRSVSSATSPTGCATSRR